MHFLRRREASEYRMADIRKKIGTKLLGPKTPADLGKIRPNRSAEYMACRVELAVATEERILQFSRAEIRMPPRCRGSVVSIQILFGDPSSREELVVLLGSGNWSEYVERSNVRIETAQYIEVFSNRGRCVVGKTEDIGKMADDAVFAAELYDFPVC